MRFYLLLIFIVCGLQENYGQSIAASNFRHWYDPQNDVELQIRPIRMANKIMVRYTLIVRQGSPEKYAISWEARNSYTDRDGVRVVEKDSVLSSTAKDRRGFLIFDVPVKPWLLVGRVTHNSNGRSWVYFKQIESIYPIDGWMEAGGGTITENHLTINKEYTARNGDGKMLTVSYYKSDFPAALPPFAEKEGRSERFLFHDSLFRIESGAKFIPRQEGLYLFQEDTTAARGFSYRVVKQNFPRFTKVDELIAPLILITDGTEYNNLTAAKGDKTAFDRVILGITGDKERARLFMKNFFHNVELANIFFSSYKEGWKTDRGMIYLVMGLPDEVSKNSGNEIWNYKTINTKFTFVKSGSVYDPENYILLRDKKFTDAWYGTIDLIRKARFQ
ncbi:MAG: GWxTD domain-containing protein [Bacteroidetes bacterium]|nr:GWxTD domain-containing protein [Bacteroidota bacterium]MBS1540549.1 GWxTD domain-containing protein [Bacteroidota bacterium]